MPARSATKRLVERTAARAHQEARARSSPVGEAASIAAASTSARITMPGPPPAGVSSTVRCLSVAVARISRASSDQMPSASAVAGEADAERPGKHLGEEREHGGAEGHGPRPSSSPSSSKPCGGSTTTRPPATSTRHGGVGERHEIVGPADGAISRRSPAP